MRTPRPSALGALAALTLFHSGCHAMPGHHSAIRWELPAGPAEGPVELREGHAVVQVTLDGKGPFPFVFDTGAHGSVMDLGLARELGLELGAEVRVGSPGGGGVPGHFVTIGTLAIGGLLLHDASIVAFEGLPFRGENPPRGVLGPYGLSGLLVTLDFPAKRLAFRAGALPEPDGEEVFGWDPSKRLPEIECTVGDVPVTVHLDTGATAGVSLPTAYAEKVELDGPQVDMGFARAVDRTVPLRGGKVRGAFRIGRFTLDSPSVRFVDMAEGVGNVGSAILGQFAITIDPGASRLRLQGPADGRLVEATPRPRYGVLFESVGATPLRVAGVDPGSPAEQGGLQPGDEIVAMGGRDVSGLDAGARVEALRSTPLPLTVRRGERLVELVLRLD